MIVGSALGIGAGAQVSPRDQYDYTGGILNPLTTVTTTASSTSAARSASSSGGTRAHAAGKKRGKSVKSPCSEDDDDDSAHSNEDRECERRFQNNARER